MSDTIADRHPDRDEPKMMCGYPLPCPHHTVVLDLKKQTVTFPLASDATKSPVREQIGDIGRAMLAGPKNKQRRRR
jgi:hypothetical protein